MPSTVMPSTVASRRILRLSTALLVALAGCGPAAAPLPPPTPTLEPATTASASATTTVVEPSASKKEEPPAPQKEEAAAVDYGSPPKAPCIRRDAIPPSKAALSAGERKAKRFEIATKIVKAGPLYVELDPRKPGVVVPPAYSKVGRLVLVVGYDLPQPIPDLVVNADGVSGRLLFKGNTFSTRVPWEAVYGLMNEADELWRWSEDVPADAICPASEP